MNRPIDPFVADVVDLLDEDLREEFEERAAIVEFDAGQPRDHAECLALLSIFRRHRHVFDGVLVVGYELYGVPWWLLTIDMDVARKHLEKIGGVETFVVDLIDYAEHEHARLAPRPASD